MTHDFYDYLRALSNTPIVVVTQYCDTRVYGLLSSIGNHHFTLSIGEMYPKCIYDTSNKSYYGCVLCLTALTVVIDFVDVNLVLPIHVDNLYSSPCHKACDHCSVSLCNNVY